jgi:hypothetical protein
MMLNLYRVFKFKSLGMRAAVLLGSMQMVHCTAS